MAPELAESKPSPSRLGEPIRLSLLPFEDVPVVQPSDALHWIAIYQEMRALLATPLVQTAEAAEQRQRGREHAEARLGHWRRRYWELSGVTGLMVGSELQGAGGSVQLSLREQELLAFLITHAHQFWSSQVLMARAWGDSRLPSEQVRNYIGRLRLKLKAAGAPCRIHTRRSRGYALIPDPSPSGLVSIVSSAVSLARLRSR